MNLKGGYKILLLPILTLVEVATAFTDSKILEQLSTLKTYMGKKELKPILVHCEIEKDSTITKHCVMCELKKISDTEYVIIGKIDTAYLTISVKFTQDEETGEYYIASGDAKYIYSDTLTVSGLLVDGESAINGDLTVFGDIIGRQITGTEITELMSGYSFTNPTSTGVIFENIYASVVKTGNKLTFVISLDVTKTQSEVDNNPLFGSFTIPQEIHNKLIPSQVGTLSYLDNRIIQFYSSGGEYITRIGYIKKQQNNIIGFVINIATLVVDTKYHCRYEATFLLSENLASE